MPETVVVTEEPAAPEPSGAQADPVQQATEALEILRIAREQGEAAATRHAELAGALTAMDARFTPIMDRFGAIETSHGELRTALAALAESHGTTQQALADLNARLSQEQRAHAKVVQQVAEPAPGAGGTGAPPPATDPTPTKRRRWV